MLKYKLPFTNQINESYLIEFWNKNYEGAVTPLVGTAEALVIRSINNDDDRFSPILSKECIISLHIPPPQDIGIEDFLAQEDDEWNIIIYRELGQPAIFNGYLVVEDSSQPLHDRPYQLTLRASDGLSLLKNIPLSISDGTAFLKFNNFTDYIGHILYRVNPTIPVRIYFDIYHKDMVLTTSPFEQMQVDALTFEKEAATYVDGYTALEMILNATGCRVFFENGCWHIVSIWSYRRSNGYNWTEYEVANDQVVKVTSKKNDVYHGKIGKSELLFPINKDATIYYKVAAKSVKKTFNYEIPKEIICNQQLQRGTVIETAPNYQTLTLDCWEHYKLGFLSTQTPANQAYIKIEFNEFGYEHDRYAVLPTEANNIDSAHLRTSKFYVSEGDKIDISVEVRHKNNYSGAQNAIVFFVFLRGDNGQNFSLEDNNADGVAKWYPSTANFSNARAIQMAYGGDQADRTKWRKLTANSDAIPTTGDIQLIFLEESAGGYPNETWIKNLKVDYYQWIRNSFKPVDGDFNLYEQNLKLNRTIEDEVQISDSPKKLIKGALFVNELLATPEWRRLGFGESLRFMQIQTLIKYTYHFKQFQKIEGTIKGLSLYNALDENIPFGFLPQYSFTDIPNNSDTRYILTSFDVNYVTAHWRGVFVEVKLNGTQTFDTYEFNYLFE